MSKRLPTYDKKQTNSQRILALHDAYSSPPTQECGSSYSQTQEEDDFILGTPQPPRKSYASRKLNLGNPNDSNDNENTVSISKSLTAYKNILYKSPKIFKMAYQ